jgi:hypothetical protein
MLSKKMISRMIAGSLLLGAFSNMSYGGPLHDTVRTGNVNKVKYIIERMETGRKIWVGPGFIKLDPICFINKADEYGLMPLHYAVGGGNVEIVKLLLGKGADVNAKEWYEDKTPLHYAVEGGNVEIVKLLLDKGANVNARNWRDYRRNQTPLDIAIEKENQEMEAILREHEGLRGAEVM